MQSATRARVSAAVLATVAVLACSAWEPAAARTAHHSTDRTMRAQACVTIDASRCGAAPVAPPVAAGSGPARSIPAQELAQGLRAAGERAGTALVTNGAPAVIVHTANASDGVDDACRLATVRIEASCDGMHTLQHPEAFTVDAQADDSSNGDEHGNTSTIAVRAAGARGLLYGLARVASDVARRAAGACSEPAAIASARGTGAAATLRCRAALQRVASGAPAFASRMYAHVGQLLDIPDVGYYTPTPPYINTTRIAGEASSLLHAMPALLSARYNAFAWYHPNFEDYLDYDWLSPAVYNTTDPHRVLSSALRSQIRNFTDALHAQGMGAYLATFELVAPPALLAAHNLSSLHSPELPTVLAGKYCELFDDLPSLDGVLVYTSDSWSPRAGYDFKVLWSTPADQALWATLLYDAVVTKCGRQLQFQLWSARGGKTGWQQFVDGTPKDLSVGAHVMDGDFCLDASLNPTVTGGGGRDRRMWMLLDAFRHMDGWGRTVAMPSQLWPRALSTALAQGVYGGVVFGSWCPFNWPSSGPQLLNATASELPRSWAGRWNSFRIYPTSADDAWFSPMQGNVALLGDLLWDPSADVVASVAAWASSPPLSLPYPAALAVAGAFNMSEAAWRSRFTPGVGCFSLKWTMVWNPSQAGLDQLATNSVASLRALNDAGERVTSEIVRLVAESVQGAASAVASVVPRSSATATARAALLLAAQKTDLYVRTTGAFRVAYVANRSLASSDNAAVPAGCPIATGAVANLTAALQQWRLLAPFTALDSSGSEAVRWNLVQRDPMLDVRPDFMRADNMRAVADWLAAIAGDVAAVCGRGSLVQVDI